MAEKRPLHDQEMEALFGDAQSTAPTPSDEMMARIMADAAAHASKPAGLPASRSRNGGIMMAVLAAIGGWKPAAGLAFATIAGVMIGYVAPEALDTVTSGTFLSADSAVDDFLPTFDDLLSEG